MMQRLLALSLLLLGLDLVLAGPGAAADLPELPDPMGKGGMAAGLDKDGDIVAVGGTNFVHGLPWNGGIKRFYDDVLCLRWGRWNPIGHLPKSVAYASFGSWHGSLVIVGGCNSTGHLSESWMLSVLRGKLRIKPLPRLPTPLAYAVGCVSGDSFYVVGGQLSPTTPRASDAVYVLDLSAPVSGWKTVSHVPKGGRILSGIGSSEDELYVFGGCSLEGTPSRIKRIYQASVLALNIKSLRWSALTDMPTPLAAMGTPAISVGRFLVIAGGDDGSHNGLPAQTRGPFGKWVFALDTLARRWEAWPDLPEGLATFPSMKIRDRLVTVGGETRPGIRSRKVHTIQLKEPIHLRPIDLAAALAALAALAAIPANSRQPNRGEQSPRTSRDIYRWTVVGALWVAVLLNYLDRQMLTSMHDPVIESIPQTETQFGLLIGVFLIVYALCSPLGGYLADRYSRRAVILTSMILWSIITWLTGESRTYPELLACRALMGVSEACYIPAALALVADLHTNRTRSLATGLHQSGIYAGRALAGIGGWVALSVGWRRGFSVLGIVGVAYALVLMFFLRPDDRQGPTNQEATQGNLKHRRLSSLLMPGFLMLLVVVGLAGMANWFIVGWLPTLLKEKFKLDLASAGLLATLPTTIANYFAVLAGGAGADAWSIRNPKARSLLTGIGFVLCGPLLVATLYAAPIAAMMGVSLLTVFLACIVAQASAQGVMDATLMPILRGQISRGFAATGYGWLNFVSAGMGGIIVIFGGAFRDRGYDAVHILGFGGAGLFLCGLILLLIPKPRFD